MTATYTFTEVIVFCSATCRRARENPRTFSGDIKLRLCGTIRVFSFMETLGLDGCWNGFFLSVNEGGKSLFVFHGKPGRILSSMPPELYQLFVFLWSHIERGIANLGKEETVSMTGEVIIESPCLIQALTQPVPV